MNIIRNNDFRCKVDEDTIRIKKGIWNFLEIELNKGDFDKTTFKKLKDIFMHLSLENDITIKTDDKKILEIINELEQYDVFENKSKKAKKVDLIVTDLKLDNFQNVKTINFDDYNKIFTKEFKHTLFIFNQNTKMMKQINTRMRKLKSAYSYIILDGDFMHLMSFNDINKACFECFEKRINSRIDDFSQNNELLNKSNIDKRDEINFLLNLNHMIWKNSRNTSYNALNGNVFSLYKPTMELQFDRLLRMPNCTECGNYSKKESKNLNVNLANFVSEVISND